MLVGSLSGCGASVRTLDVSHVPTLTLPAIDAMPKETLGKIMTTPPNAMVVLLHAGEKVPLRHAAERQQRRHGPSTCVHVLPSERYQTARSQRIFTIETHDEIQQPS